MRRRLASLLALSACLLIAVPAAAGAAAKAPPAPSPDTMLIGPSVTAGGVDVSNLTVSAAAQRLTQQLGPVLSKWVIVQVAGRTFAVVPSRVGLRFDALRTAKRAYYASANRAAPAPGQEPAPVAVAAAVGHSRLAVRAFVSGIARRVSRSARNATVVYSLTRLRARHSTPGVGLDTGRLSSTIDRVLDNPAAARVVRQAVRRTRPKITYADLLRSDGTVVTVDREHFRLRLFKRLRLATTYPVAVGRVGLATPAGLYHVLDKEVNPAWHVPNSAWAGSLAGQTIPGGVPGNPLVARWMGLGGGIGIHGTNEPWTVGSAASHGCIRMRPEDVIALYPRVPLGTPVLIG